MPNYVEDGHIKQSRKEAMYTWFPLRVKHHLVAGYGPIIRLLSVGIQQALDLRKARRAAPNIQFLTPPLGIRGHLPNRGHGKVANWNEEVASEGWSYPISKNSGPAIMQEVVIAIVLQSSAVATAKALSEAVEAAQA